MSREIRINPEGWAYDVRSDEWVWLSEENAYLYSDSKGWIYSESEGEIEPYWGWPTAEEPVISNSHYYVERHPTRYFWRPDVEKIARSLVNDYHEAVWCNTYWDHPEGWGFAYAGGSGWQNQHTSLDVWGEGGRGSWLDSAIGDEIFQRLFWDESEPHINWIIWKQYIYGAWNSWYGEYFGDGSVFTNHDDHIHVTYH